MIITVDSDDAHEPFLRVISCSNSGDYQLNKTSEIDI